MLFCVPEKFLFESKDLESLNRTIVWKIIDLKIINLLTDIINKTH